MSDVTRYDVYDEQGREGHAIAEVDGQWVKFTDYAALAPAWSQERPVKPGFYWWRMDHEDQAPLMFEVYAHDGEPHFVGLRVATYHEGEWAGPLIVPPEGTR